MPLKITHYTPTQNGNTLGEFGFHIEEWDMYFTKCRLIQKKDGSGKFVSFPAYKDTDEQGQPKYKNYYWFGPNASRRIQDALLKALDEHIARAPVQEEEFTEENVPF